MARIIALLFFSSLFYACHSGTVYKDQIKDFDNNRWQKERSLEFRFDIKESGTYRIDFLMRHTYGFQFAEIPVVARIELPDGAISRTVAVLQLYDEDKKQKGDCLGDYCDFEQPLFNQIDLPSGTYLLSVSHEFNHEYLPNVLSAGIAVKTLEQ